MKEYIEREVAENAIRNGLPLSTWMKRSVDKAAHAMGVTVDAIEDIPAADVAEVVRCKDCIHYEMGVCLKIYDDGALNKDAWQKCNQNDFCSYGERRDETEAQK